MAGTGYVFKVAVEAQRTANATSEIMRNLRGITDQLNTDFAGLQTDTPLAIWFQQDTGDPNQRYDEVMFFATGDFSSYRAEYGSSGNQILKGNAARIWYGQADTNDLKNKPLAITTITPPLGLRSAARVLARNQHVLTMDNDCNIWPEAHTRPIPSRAAINFSEFRPEFNEKYEYEKLSLAQWKNIDGSAGGDFQNKVVPSCLGETVFNGATVRPDVNPALPETYSNLMCKGVGSFAVQWGYYYDNSPALPAVKEWRWWPSDDPDGDKNNSDSHFGLRGNPFGVYFNITGGDFTTSTGENWYVAPIGGAFYEANAFPDNFPQAIKFTFTLYDSKGIIKKGLKFTHIVYLKQ
jgi:hypothetical protein